MPIVRSRHHHRFPPNRKRCTSSSFALAATPSDNQSTHDCNGTQQQQQQTTRKTIAAGTTPEKESPVLSLSSSASPDLESILNRARRRTFVGPLYRIQALIEQPLLQVQPYRHMSFFPKALHSTWLVWTVGDAILVMLALTIHAKGFGVGWILAKTTANPIRRLWNPPPLMDMIWTPLWPVILAIGVDQLF